MRFGACVGVDMVLEGGERLEAALADRALVRPFVAVALQVAAKRRSLSKNMLEKEHRVQLPTLLGKYDRPTY